MGLRLDSALSQALRYAQHHNAATTDAARQQSRAAFEGFLRSIDSCAYPSDVGGGRASVEEFYQLIITDPDPVFIDLRVVTPMCRLSGRRHWYTAPRTMTPA